MGIYAQFLTLATKIRRIYYQTIVLRNCAPHLRLDE